ncbi:MAG: hypothetical protein ABIJ09_14490 [Pseudomonadota bacterium]
MRCAVSMVLVLGLALSTTASAATRAPANPRFQFVEDDGDDFCDPGNFEKMFPWVLNDDLHAEVDDIVVMTYVLNILPLGGLWGPLLLLPKDRPDMKDGDVLVSYLVPALVGWGISVFIGSWTLIGFIPGFFVACYTAPTAALNAWDRAYKCGGQSSEGARPKSKSKSKKKSESSPPPQKSEGGGDEAYGY